MVTLKRKSKTKQEGLGGPGSRAYGILNSMARIILIKTQTSEKKT